ncbi:unnamed protein product [Arabis nemorensis]|uniref:Uncharacterized protein n=1 Tax=Arabis nemorensis TaxID=586526 RepID=A0A565AXK1_9BRAS|nr:unnamed protein product [Arabis nemorensis]
MGIATAQLEALLEAAKEKEWARLEKQKIKGLAAVTLVPKRLVLSEQSSSAYSVEFSTSQPLIYITWIPPEERGTLIVRSTPCERRKGKLSGPTTHLCPLLTYKKDRLNIPSQDKKVHFHLCDLVAAKIGIISCQASLKVGSQARAANVSCPLGVAVLGQVDTYQFWGGTERYASPSSRVAKAPIQLRLRLIATRSTERKQLCTGVKQLSKKLEGASQKKIHWAARMTTSRIVRSQIFTSLAHLDFARDRSHSSAHTQTCNRRTSELFHLALPQMSISPLNPTKCLMAQFAIIRVLSLLELLLFVSNRGGKLPNIPDIVEAEECADFNDYRVLECTNSKEQLRHQPKDRNQKQQAAQNQLFFVSDTFDGESCNLLG